MRKRIRVLISALLVLMAVLIAGTASDTGFTLRGKTQTYESEKPEAAKKKKKKKNKSNSENKNNSSSQTSSSSGSSVSVEENGEYTSKDEVAAYIHEFGHLPSNFITKKEAKKLGWISSEGNLGEVAPGKSIGGDYFGNYEGKLPEKSGRSYYECDIDTLGKKKRGAKRIIWGDDGSIYYTDDHYETFTLLYGDDDYEREFDD